MFRDMSQGKLLAICQSGGEFATNHDGSLSYSGGEAHAIDIDQETRFHDFKLEISTMFNCDVDCFSIKYFLPGNNKTLITISSDKDLQRMVDFHSSSITTDVYVLKKVENMAIRSVVADSAPQNDAIADMIGTPEDVKPQRICAGWDNLITGVGQVFGSQKDFRIAVHKYAIAKNFIYKFVKNEGARVTVACAADNNCTWRIHASRSSAEHDFTIKKMDDTHTCDREINKDTSRLANQRWVASVIKEKLRESPDYKPRDIASDLEREYGLSMNYTRAWRGKYVAKKELQNSHEEACHEVPWYCEKIRETNPGSFTSTGTTEDSRLLFFVSFHASLNGFEHGCRPLLFLDSVPLKSNKQWKLLAATGVDGENEVFPLAFAVVEDENHQNWLWFLVQLKSALQPRALTFVSHKKNGLDDAVPQVFEDSFHGYCVNHLIEDFKAVLDDSWPQEKKELVVELLKQSICTCKAEEFNGYIESIKDESAELAEWVLASQPESWSDAFFKGLRYGFYSSNIAGMFNEWISSRHEPSVVQIVDMIRSKIMEMIYIRRESSNQWAETLTPFANQKVQEELIKSQGLDVTCSSNTVFRVGDDSGSVVDIETGECTCRRWEVSGLPCKHALAVFERTNACIYDYCSNYFYVEYYRLTYSLPINPIPDAGRPLSMDLVQNKVAYPLRVRRPVGRPREKPANPCITFKRSVQCSNCKEYGHNKKTCTSNI